jgi:hypothetical protein
MDVVPEPLGLSPWDFEKGADEPKQATLQPLFSPTRLPLADIDIDFNITVNELPSRDPNPL